MKKRYLIGGSVLLLAVGYLFYLGLGSSVSYYVTVSELYEKENQLTDTSIRVIGEIVGGSIAWNAEELELRFDIAEGGDTLSVIYQGAKPSGFKAGSNILVGGKYCADRVFHAAELIMRCPSKYEVEE